jgi:methionyl aminopeptidase
MAIHCRTADEVEKLYRANQIVAEVLSRLVEEVKPGIDTLTLNKIAESMCRKRGAEPTFLNYPGVTPYPGTICASINEEVVHGIPSRTRVLKEGDILSIDFGVRLDGYCGDSALTIPVGKVSGEASRLMDATRRSLFAGIDQARIGNRLFDISYAIQTTAEAEGFSVVRDFVGHGIGREMHEPPQIPNFGNPGQGDRLAEGMVFALEPMINAGTWQVKVLDDGWTAVTADGKLSAHFEHSVAITTNGPRILSLRNSEVE